MPGRRIDAPTLKEFGLLESLTWLAEQMQRHGLPVAMQQQMAAPSRPEDQAVLLFQSVRELLFNVLNTKTATGDRDSQDRGTPPVAHRLG